ncbi:VWA domain-containing protein [Erythrobacter litoralis]|uniref:VWFA domain-containing protein n=1 Tax=Erythrobacter litoralis (strain HTCC2594) TaxID=314225 RepID=Q2N998_ERYLH|nr:VWA domain-containing protein [Erythrobacter litoralis]ABC63743.1 hypothetical protein ELI_08255 [Erythrobacter litoralis HTCC2594]
MMAIGAASIIPLVGVVGGGVDASRMYLAKSRLQQACDAATLAARKELAGSSISNGTIPANIQDKADNFFDTNFPSGMYGTTNVGYTLSAGTATQMDGAATASVPTTLMKVFNVPQIDIAVNCSAELDLPNIDVVLVLDMSGSMNSNGTTGSKRITALKNAVFSFYDVVMAAKPAGTRVRIGIVPYNGAVSVGDELLTLSTTTGIDYLADSWDYQTREPKWKQVSNNDGVEEGDILSETNVTELLPRQPSQLGSGNSAHYHWNANKNAKKDKDCYDYAGQSYTVGSEIWEINSVTWDDEYWGDKWKKAEKAACVANITKKTIAGPDDVKPETFRTEFDKYVYLEKAMDISGFKTGTSVSTRTGSNGGWVSSSWTNGCIEERQTIAASSFDPLPTGAHDLDIDLVPDSSKPETQWYPMWPQITYDRGGPATLETTDDKPTRGYNCPNRTHKLQEYLLNGSARNADFVSRINALSPKGGTMHDIGMIWAGRLISPDGIFAADNASAPNGDPISRHVIFMTDGEMGASPSNTTAYGNYDMDGRMAGFAASGSWTENQLAAIHNLRLEAICKAIRNKNVTIWSIAFGLPHSAYTQGCATGTSRALTAANSSELDSRFRDIAGSIAELRLVN